VPVWALTRGRTWRTDTFLGLIDPGRIFGFLSCSWASIIIGIKQPPFSSSFTSFDQPPDRIFMLA